MGHHYRVCGASKLNKHKEDGLNGLVLFFFTVTGYNVKGRVKLERVELIKYTVTKYEQIKQLIKKGV